MQCILRLLTSEPNASPRVLGRVPGKEPAAAHGRFLLSLYRLQITSCFCTICLFVFSQATIKQMTSSPAVPTKSLQHMLTDLWEESWFETAHIILKMSNVWSIVIEWTSLEDMLHYVYCSTNEYFTRASYNCISATIRVRSFEYSSRPSSKRVIQRVFRHELELPKHASIDQNL